MRVRASDTCTCCARLRGAGVLSVCGCGTRVLRKGVLLRDTYVPHRRLPLDHSREKPHVSRDPVRCVVRRCAVYTVYTVTGAADPKCNFE